MEEFHKQYTEQRGKAMAFKELYNVLESADTMARNLAEQIKNPVKDYSLGLKNEPTTNKS